MKLFSTPQSAIRSVLIAQVVLGAAIVAIDMRADGGRAAPGLFQPQDGPQVRPYRPDQRPAEPGAPAMRPMPQRLEFTAEDGVLRIEGQIAVGDADRFTAFIDETRPEATEVALDSSGGSVADALAIGRTIRGAGWDTRVGRGSVCLSACPYLLAGGRNRAADAGSTVGVHQHYFGKNTMLPAFMAVSDLQRAQASVMDYLTEMGVDLAMMIPALRTAPDDITVLTESQMRDWRLTSSPGA